MDERIGGLQEFTRERLVRALRRWAPLVVAAAVGAGAVSFAVSQALPPEYRARATLFLAPAANPTVALGEVIAGQSLVRSYAQLATEDVILRPAMERVSLQDLDVFRERTQVAQVRDTLSIEVSFRDRDPSRAAAAANAIADSFIAQSRSLQPILQATITLWQPAVAPPRPESPRVALITVLGALSGGLLALLAVTIVSYFDDRITTPDEVRSRLRIPFLGEVHRAGHPESLKGKLFVRDEPASPEAEAFRSLRTTISFARVDRPPRTLLVTSAVPFEGKSVVSANLALAYAQSGVPTVLVDADLRRPSQHRLFRIRANPGLTSLLTGNAPETFEHLRVLPNLVVIPSGPLPPDPAELLSSSKMSALIRQLSGLADGCIVIIDTSPVLAVADPLALAAKVDGCILVVDTARTRANAARRAVDSFRQVRGELLGAVLNKVHGPERSYYGYYGARAPEEDLGTAAGQSAQAKGG